MNLKDAYSIVCDATAYRRYKEEVDQLGEAYQIILDAVRKQIENNDLSNVMVEPIEVDEKYRKQNIRPIPLTDDDVKPEFKKHLKNDNWKDEEYRKKNNIITDCHPAYYYETLKNFIIMHDPKGPNFGWCAYDKDARAFANFWEERQKNEQA